MELRKQRVFGVHSLCLTGFVDKYFGELLDRYVKPFPRIKVIEIAGPLVKVPVANLKPMLLDRGLKATWCVFIGKGGSHPLKPGRKARMEARDYFLQQADMAAAVGASWIVGPWVAPIQKREFTSDRAWDRASEHVRFVKEECQKRGIRAALEALRKEEDPLMAGEEKLMKMVDQTGVFVHGDSYHTDEWGVPQQQTICRFDQKLGYFHTSGSGRRTIGKDDISFTDVAAGLDHVSFGERPDQNIVVLEGFCERARTEIGGIANGLPPVDNTPDRFIRDSLAHLTACGVI